MGAMRSRTVRVVTVALSVVMALLIPFLVPAAALAREDADALAAQADDIASGEGWRLTSDGQLVIFGAVPDWYNTNPPWFRYEAKILSVVALDGASVSTCGWMFSGCYSLASLDLSALDTSAVTDMGSMFSGCSSLASLDLSGFDTSHVTDMSGMFRNCSSLSSLDLSGFDTSSVTNMNGMFYGCSSLSSLDLSGFDTSSVTNMQLMFSGCSSLSSLDLSGFDTSSVTNMNAMFQNCSNLSSLDLSGFDASAVTDMGGIFYNCYNLSTLDISGWDTTSVSYKSNMFYNCQKLAKIRAEGLRLGSIGISFTGASALESLEGTASWDTSAVTTTGSMFRRCSNLTSLDLSGWDTSHVTSMAHMFEDCNNLSSLDLSGWDTSSATNMREMFRYCWSLSSLDLSGWDTSHVTSMGCMFDGCGALTSLDLSGWDISSVTDDITDMFSGCQKLAKIRAEGLRLGSIGVSFSDLSALESVEGTSSWDTSAVKDMGSMFYNCYNLSSLDLSGWDTSSVTGMSAMFWGCSKLKTIVVSDLWSVEGVKYDDRVFEGCTSLVGGRGTRYSPDHTDKEYARVDAEGAPGYLTFGEGPGPGHVPFEVVDSVPITDARFTFRSGLSPTDEMGSLISYDDRWVFSTDERDTYSLMRASIRVAMAAFGTVGDGSPKYIEALMDTLGFDYTKESVHYPKPTQETIGYAIGMRNVRLADGSERSIVLVAIRGGGYGREWGDNFRVGGSSVHEGFDNAAEEVRSGLMAFLQAHEDDLCGKVAVWACGYSRAAATTNLLAKKLISSDDAYGIGERDVRAFCFECPQNVAVGRDVAGAAMYDNIVSVVNPIDFVPKVAPSGWGFTRYGRTYYIPSRETSWGYDGKKTVMSLTYEDLLESNGLDYSEKLHSECIGQAYSLDAIIHGTTTAISRDAYQHIFQDDICAIFANALGGNGGYEDAESLAERIDSIVYGCSALDWRLKLAINAGATEAAWSLFHAPFDDVTLVNFAMAHYPELCLSWVDTLGSLDAFETSTTNKYVRLVVNCPVDVTVRDSAGEVVGSIVGDVPGEGDRVVTLVDSDGQKVVVLPMDERFSLELEATEAGEVTYTAIEFDADECANERVVAYEEVAVGPGDVLVGGMEDGDGGGVEYTLTGPGGEALDPDLEAQGDDVPEFLVEATAAEGGSVSGGGTYVQDTFCLLAAEPDEGWGFDGWYEGGELVAEEPELRLRVTADATLEARFVEAPGPFFLDADPADDANHGAEVDWMGRSGISEGWGAEGGRVYNGLWNVKRCDFAAFLYRMADLTDDGERNDSCAPTDGEVAQALAGVSDCDASTPHSMEVAWLIGTGISRGWADPGGRTVSFRPMSDIKRQDMAAFLHRFADLADDGEMDGSPEMGDQQLRFSDVTHGDEANHASDVEWLASVGVTRGWDNHDGTYSFGGLRDIVRQDMAAFMKRLYDHMSA